MKLSDLSDVPARQPDPIPEAVRACLAEVAALSTRLREALAENAQLRQALSPFASYARARKGLNQSSGKVKAYITASLMNYGGYSATLVPADWDAAMKALGMYPALSKPDVDNTTGTPPR